jgi:DNA-binding transcriptional MocR family regulator
MMVTLLVKWRMLQAILRDRDLSPAAKAVAASLLDRYNTKSGRCNPSYQTLADDTGYDRRQIMRAAADLRRQGWITTSRGASRLPSNEFEFAWLRVGADQGNDNATDGPTCGSDVTSDEAKDTDTSDKDGVNPRGETWKMVTVLFPGEEDWFEHQPTKPI